MSVLNENTIIGASAAGGDYEIEQSLRFNKPDSAYLSRTPSTASNRKTWTWSGWVKLNGADNRTLFSASNPSDTGHMIRVYTNQLSILGYNGGFSYQLRTNQLFRDPSAWYHVVASVDTTQSTASNRVKMYVNGEQVTSFSEETYPSQNFETFVNTTNEHYLGVAPYSDGLAEYFDGYLAEVNFIDGLALTPDSFGETGDYGEWKAKSYAGGYGTNGFNLKFENASSLGNDSAGSNNWTPNNLAATDQMLDSPTNNFATLNVLDDSNSTISEGNLKTVNGGSYTGARATMAFPSTGKWYVEYAEFSTRRSGSVIGALRLSAAGENLDAWPTQAGLYWGQNGLEVTTGGMTTSPFNGIGQGDILQMAYDSDTGKVWLGVNNQWVRASGSTVITDGNPAGGTNQTYTWGSPTEDTFWSIWNYGLTGVANFGSDSSFAGNKTPQSNPDGNDQADFFYTPPTGFLALCTANLPSVDVIPSEHFNTVLYTGNGANRSISGVGFGSAPDFVWIKNRDGTNGHQLLDVVRGATKHLSSNTANAQSTAATGLTSFDSDGFSLGTATGVNTNGDGFVAWNWKAGGSASTLTTGTINSVVSANPSAGFSIVKYVGNNTANATIAHGLSQTPTFIITKNMTNSAYWATYLFNDVNKKYYLNDSSGDGSTGWITPASALITLGANNTNNINESGSSYINYCFHSVDGYSRVGEYTGNGNADGTFAYCGFRPKYVLIRRNLDAYWNIFDTERGPYNVINNVLWANGGDTETVSANWNIDLLSNGFKQRGVHDYMNDNGETFFFIAFAETPFKFSNAR